MVDGHGSRFGLGFFKYICYENHKWSVLFGVPYGTSLWQVGYPKGKNGTYKIHIVKSKHEIITNWIEDMIGEI